MEPTGPAGQVICMATVMEELPLFLSLCQKISIAWELMLIKQANWIEKIQQKKLLSLLYTWKLQL